MGFRCGIVGLPNVGKSTIFNALAKAHAPASNYPFCTIEPNIGIVAVPDPRLDELTRLYRPEKSTPTTIEFFDIAGLVEGAHKGEGLGNQFLGQVKEVDAILHVVRCFEDPNVAHLTAPHRTSPLDPIHDIDVVETELCLKDLETMTKRFHETEKLAHSGDKGARELMPLYEKVKKALEAGKPLRLLGLTDEDKKSLQDLFLITLKPVLYCANVSEADLPEGGMVAKQVKERAAKEGAEVVVISGKVEAELVELSNSEREEFVKSLGLEELAFPALIHAGYRLLDLVTYFTVVGGKEIRAWTVKRGAKAPQAAGQVHSDFEKGFVRAEVMRYEDLIRYGSAHAVKEKGHLRIEGKDYVVQDGDVIHFRFNV